MVYVVSGPSGCGKSTLIRLALAKIRGLCFSVSHTTRPKRKGEVEGKDYYFISTDKFRTMIRRKAFLEWAVVHGAYYGTSKKELSKAAKADLVLDIDIQGARQLKAGVKDAVFIFILPPSYEVLKKRLETRRLDSQEAIRRRLKTAAQEVGEYVHFDHVIINDDLADAAEELASIILCERSNTAAKIKGIEPILQSFRKKRREKA